MLFLPLMTNLCLTSCPAITPPARKNQQPPVSGRVKMSPTIIAGSSVNAMLKTANVAPAEIKSRGEQIMVMMNAPKYARFFVNTIGSSCSDHHSLVGICVLP